MKHLRFLLAASSLLLAAFLPAAEAENPPRIAVVAEGKAAPFGDLLLVELGTTGACQLVERAELDRLARESSLLALAADQRPLAAARLAKADALLFVREDTSTGAAIVVLRLTTVADGIVRHAVVLPWTPTEMPANAKLAARQFQAPLASLRAAPGQPLSLSLLGMRSVLGGSKLTAFEIALNTRLAHRLVTEPGLVVLERWRMDDLVFERALQPLGAPDFKTGSLLVDGSFTAQGDRYTLRLRTRTSESDPGAVRELTGTDVPSLVDAVSAALTAQRPSGTHVRPWQPEQEARAYDDLGAWLLKYALHAEAAQAAEAAVALHPADPLFRAHRVWAYGQCAYRDMGMGFAPLDQGYSDTGALLRPDQPYRLVAAQRACEYARDLLAESEDIPGATSVEQPRSLALLTFFKTVRLLRAVVSLRAQTDMTVSLQATRAALTDLIAKLDRSTVANNIFYLNYRANYAAYWCATPEDTLAYYRRALAPDYAAKSTPLRISIFPTEVRETLLDISFHGPFLDRAPRVPAETTMTSTERLVDWTGNDAARMLQMWKGFLQELRRAEDLQSQADALGFEFASHADPANRTRLQAEMVDWLWLRREAIVRSPSLAIYSSLRLDFSALATQEKHVEFHDRLIKFLLLALAQADWLPPVPFQWLKRLATASPPGNLQKEETRALLAALDSYIARRKADPRWTPSYEQDVLATRLALSRSTPEEIPAVATLRIDARALPVTHAWMSALHLTNDSRSSFASRYDQRPQTLGNRHFINSSKGVVSIDPATLETRVAANLTGTPSGWRICPTAQDLWAADQKEVRHMPLAGGEWASVELPAARYSVQPVGNRVFAISPPLQSAGPDGWTLYELLPAGPRLIFSTRRKPPEHPIDGRLFGSVRGFFAGPGNEPWIALSGTAAADGTAIIALEHAREPVIQVPKWTPTFKTDGARTLILEMSVPQRIAIVSGLWLIDPARPEPQLLLHDSANSARPNAGTPRWTLAESMTRPAPGTFPRYSAVTRGDELWILRWLLISTPTGAGAIDLELYGFLPDRKSSIRIPLQLIVTPENLQAIQAKAPPARTEALTRPSLSTDCLTATDHGLAIGGDGNAVLWLVPWIDLHQWIKTHP